MTLYYRNRETGQLEEEKIFGEKALRFLYEDRFLGRPLLRMIARFPLWSLLYGWWQSRSWTRKNIAPFIRNYGVDSREFEKSVGAFTSFNDFFIRKLKPDARPIDPDPAVIVAPADGRYLAIPDVSQCDGFYVKGQKLSLQKLLGNDALAKQYEGGTIVITRLCPSDYHRFHFPCSGTCSDITWINGWLYSVNPIALRRNIAIFAENKRCYSTLDTDMFGPVLILEVGATSVGTIIQTYKPGEVQEKGAEKGAFAFGASTVILLFEKGRIALDKDLAATANEHIELRCRMGEPIARTV